jgi:hypothetical protein
MKKLIIFGLSLMLPFLYISSAVAGTCPFGGSPNWKGVCDTTTDTGQSYFGPTLSQQDADAIGPAPTPPPPPPPPPTPEPEPSPTPTVQPEVPVQTLLMLVLGLLSQNNAILNALNSRPSPTPTPSPTTSSPAPTPSESSTPTEDPNPTSPSPEASPSASPSQTQSEETSTNTEISQRSISVKPVIIDNTAVINKKINEDIFKNMVIIVATKGKKQKTWSQQVSGNVVNIKIPRKYLFWKISIRYMTK